jgi:hypothetical protein
MSGARRRQDLAGAEAQFALERRALGATMDVLHTRFGHHRIAWVAGGGLATGFIAGLVPKRALSRTLRPVLRVATFAMQLPLGALVALIAPAAGRSR